MEGRVFAFWDVTSFMEGVAESIEFVWFIESVRPIEFIRFIEFVGSVLDRIRFISMRLPRLINPALYEALYEPFFHGDVEERLSQDLDLPFQLYGRLDLGCLYQ